MDDQTVVLAIKDDGLLHVATAGAMLDHLRENPAGPDPTVELFGREGQRLTVVQRRDGPFAIEPDGGPPDAAQIQLLLDRVDLVLSRWQVLLDTDPPLPLGSEPVPKRVLRVSGELPMVVDALQTLFPSLPSETAPTPGGYWHRVAHKLGTAH